MVELRPYQTRLIESARNALGSHNATCVVAPTGAGKTVTFAALAKMATAKGGNVLILANRIGLVEQAAEKMDAARVPFMVYHGDRKHAHGKVVISTAQTFTKDFPNGFNAKVTVLDECHLSIFDEYANNQKQFGKVIGFTATPFRLDKKKPMVKVYESLVQEVTTQELIDEGYLVKPHYKVTDVDLSGLAKDSSGDYSNKSQQKVFCSPASFCDEYIKHHLGCGLVFTVGVDNAQMIANELCSRGLPAAMICGKHTEDQRNQMITMLEAGLLKALVNADLLTFGFDCPAVNTVAVYRATTSLALWHQMIGRGARLCTNKDVFKVLDFGGNLMRIGLWEEDIDWQQHFDPPKKKKSDGVAPVKECPQCFAFAHTTARECKNCGYEWPLSETELIEAKLIDYINRPLGQVPTEEFSIPELITFAKTKGYKTQWVHHELCRRENNLAHLTQYFTLIQNPKPSHAARATMQRLGYLPR